MRFGRYASYVRDNYIVLGVIFLVGLCVFVPYAIEKRYSFLIPAFVLGYLMYMLVWQVLMIWVAKADGGQLSDYIILTDNRVELHNNKSVISIYWSDVVEIRQHIPPRGMRALKIIAKDGTQISFASNGGREKQIWKIHPELRSKLKTR